jgi:hypothetical protein
VALATVIVAGAWTATTALGEFDIGYLESGELFKLGAFFLSGAVLAALWPWVGGNAMSIGAAGLAATLLLRNLLPSETLLHPLALAAAVVGLGQSGRMASFSKGGDPSYGMYVFAWPLQQFCLLLIEPFWLSLFVAFVATTAVGYGTWHGFEKRALSYTDQLAELLRSGVRRRHLAAGDGSS